MPGTTASPDCFTVNAIKRGPSVATRARAARLASLSKISCAADPSTSVRKLLIARWPPTPRPPHDHAAHHSRPDRPAFVLALSDGQAAEGLTEPLETRGCLHFPCRLGPVATAGLPPIRYALRTPHAGQDTTALLTDEQRRWAFVERSRSEHLVAVTSQPGGERRPTPWLQHPRPASVTGAAHWAGSLHCL